MSTNVLPAPNVVVVPPGTPVARRPDVLAVNVVTKLMLVLSFLLAAPIWIGKLQDDLTPLGLPAYYWAYATVAILVSTVVVRSAIAAVQIYVSGTTGVGHGLSSYLTIVTTILASAPIWIGQLADAAAPLNIDPSVWLKVTTIAATAGAIAKGLQHLSAGVNEWKPPAPVLVPGDFPPVTLPPTTVPPVLPGEVPPIDTGGVDVPGPDVPGAGPGEGLPQG